MQNPINYESVSGANKLDLQQCILQFQESGNTHLFKVILFKLRPTFNHYLFHKTDYSDKSELLALCEDKLMECIINYESDRNSSFLTYYCRCLDNALINFIKSKKRRLASEVSLDKELLTDEKHEEGNTIQNLVESRNVEMERLEVKFLLEDIKPILDINEYKICSIILRENQHLRYKELAQRAELTVAAIPNILSRLQKKYRDGLFTDIFCNHYKKST